MVYRGCCRISQITGLNCLINQRIILLRSILDEIQKFRSIVELTEKESR